MNEKHISKPFGLGKAYLLQKLIRELEKGVSLTEVHYSIEQEENTPYISERPYYLISNYPLSVRFEEEVFQFSVEYRMPVELVKRDYGYEAVTDSPIGQIQIRRLKIHLDKIFYVNLTKGEKDKLAKAIERGILMRGIKQAKDKMRGTDKNDS